MHISETPSPTGLQSPKFPKVALRRRAKILAFAFWSDRPDSHASKSDDRINVFIRLYCIRLDTTLQAGGSRNFLFKAISQVELIHWMQSDPPGDLPAPTVQLTALIGSPASPALSERFSQRQSFAHLRTSCTGDP